MTAHVSVTAVITDRWGETTEEWCGTQPEWAWAHADEWRKMMRRQVLGARTADPRGWRVTWRAVPEDES